MIFLYISFLFYDYRLFNNGNFKSIIENHQHNIENSESINAIIIGGSNAAFGLSAKQLSNLSEYEWYNASLMHEGFSDHNYQQFIENSFKSKRLNIKLIIYSPINHFRDGVIDERNRYIGPVYGINNFNLRPRMSMVSHLKLILNKSYENVKNGFPLPDNYGDFVFNKYTCQGSNSELPFEHDELSKAASYLAKNVENYLLLFPNAKLFLSHPSEFYGNFYDNEIIDIFQNNLNKSVYNLLKSNPKHDLIQRVAMVNQKTIIDKNLICEGKHHLNYSGRSFRTDFIFQQLSK